MPPPGAARRDHDQSPVRSPPTNRSLTAAGALCLTASALSAETYSADVWADNWFEMRVNGAQVAEDSVPITTERSFNAESFTFEAERPFTIGLVAKDFIENDTGLEYIGTRRQQMGDGGVILQITDAQGTPVALSNADWQCHVIHTAPLDKSCENEASPVAGEGVCAFDISEDAFWLHIRRPSSGNGPRAHVTDHQDIPRHRRHRGAGGPENGV
ncbi:hypothetical protein Q4543_09415 [Salipiger sp. 1_MG-2023]|uniref:hypothetical protein n=1 Tax=Salipiger sp. 1_MG-2023 TaxID=3062665 RepID=UPI0026E151BE|nr:hypothetical protein [Salipiger sp. 1_MG-2023]MDO6585739.1 hypothetical protein [Salipiger sp. 1_MG-2023]